MAKETKTYIPSTATINTDKKIRDFLISCNQLDYVEEATKRATDPNLKGPAPEVTIKCPKCGGTLKIAKGTHGFYLYLGCQNRYQSKHSICDVFIF